MKRKHTHIGAYGIITKENKIVLIKKARGGYTGKLDLPGGGIEHNETPEEALRRELMEEVGIKVTSEKLLTVRANNIVWQMTEKIKEDLHHIGVLYLVETKDNNIKTTPDGIDSNGANYYSIDQINLADLTPFAKYAVLYLMDNR